MRNPRLPYSRLFPLTSDTSSHRSSVLVDQCPSTSIGLVSSTCSLSPSRSLRLLTIDLRNYSGQTEWGSLNFRQTSYFFKTDPLTLCSTGLRNPPTYTDKGGVYVGQPIKVGAVLGVYGGISSILCLCSATVPQTDVTTFTLLTQVDSSRLKKPRNGIKSTLE